MKPRVLPIDIPLFDLGQEIFHTNALLRAYPFLAAQAAQFEPFHPGWLALLGQEVDLSRALREAQARAIVVDNDFDFLCMAIAGTVLAENGNDRKAPLYLRYFEDAPPSKLKRPVLGQQVEVMRGWVPSLTAAEASPALRAYGARLAACVPDADAATLALLGAENRRDDFQIGERKAFIDRLNGHRQALYGQLAELPHTHPELHLSKDFAHRFFLRDPGKRQPTVAELEAKLQRLHARVRKHEAKLAQLREAEEREARRRQEADVAAAQAELAELERKRAQAAKRLAAAEARRTSRRT